jgi:hypothetical protein
MNINIPIRSHTPSSNVPRSSLASLEGSCGTHKVEDTIADTADSTDYATIVFEFLTLVNEVLPETSCAADCVTVE